MRVKCFFILLATFAEVVGLHQYRHKMQCEENALCINIGEGLVYIVQFTFANALGETRSQQSNIQTAFIQRVLSKNSACFFIPMSAFKERKPQSP